MGIVVWPGEPFLKKCPNIRKSLLFPKYACPFFQEQAPKISFSPMSHRQPLAMGSSRGGAPRKCRGGLGGGRSPPQDDILIWYFQIHRLYRNGGSFSISRYTSYIGMVGPSVYPDTRVIPKWWVLQYIQIHEIISEWLDFQYFQVQTILEQLTTQFHIFKCIDFEFGCESRSSGSFRWIRLVKLVSKKSISAFIRDIVGPKLNFL